MDTLEQAKETALKYLTARLRTRQEVKQLLQKKGYTAEITAQVLEFLERYQYLDDAVYSSRAGDRECGCRGAEKNCEQQPGHGQGQIGSFPLQQRLRRQCDQGSISRGRDSCFVG